MRLHDTEMNCHCGAAYGGWDHCQICGCEQYEARACYMHRPAATGLHAKMLHEARERSEYIVGQGFSGLPNAVRVMRRAPGMCPVVWSGHRDLMPAEYRFAFDPGNVLTRPSSD